MLDFGFNSFLDEADDEEAKRRRRRQAQNTDNLQLDLNFTVINPSAASIGMNEILWLGGRYRGALAMVAPDWNE